MTATSNTLPSGGSPTTTHPPSRLGVAIRNGWRQATIELLTSIRGGQVISYLITPAVAIGFILWGGDSPIEGTGITMAQYVVPSLLAMTLVVGGILGPSGELMMEREDGSIVRMKAVPGGLQGYVFGKVFSVLTVNIVSLALVFVVAAIFLPSLVPASAGAWLRFVLFVVLGLLASVPVGIALGSAIKNAALLMIPMFLIYGLLVISGIFFPIEAFAAPVQWIAMVFPLYWLGLGLRSVFLPPEAASLELAGTWQTVESVMALGIWAVLGMVLAPILLRRMVRGVSGSTVTEARERMLSRGY
nr:ABC transporter permease [Actinomycetales bacterium]